MIEANQLMEEQWQEFDKQDKEKSMESKSDRNTAIEDEGAAHIRVEAPKKNLEPRKSRRSLGWQGHHLLFL